MQDLVGKFFGRLKVIEYAYSQKHRRYWKCICSCGVECYKYGKYLNNGDTKSCGCLVKEISAKNVKYAHKESSATKRNEEIYENGKRHPAYIIWKGMRARCNSPNNKTYKWYGARGIKICKSWDNPGIFIKWCKLNGYEKGLQLDRINNDKNYTPYNCRFITREENIRLMHEAKKQRKNKIKES